MIMQNKSKMGGIQNQRIFINEELEMRRGICAKAQKERAEYGEVNIGLKKLIIDERE